MVVDASNIATLGSVAASGYQASRLAAASAVPVEANGTEGSAALVQPPLPGGAEAKAAEVKARGQSQDVRDKDKDKEREQQEGKAQGQQGQVHMTPIFRFDGDAQRMVMLSRDIDSGTVLFQIPSEEALRQYEQTLKRQKSGAGASGPTGSVGTVSSVESNGVPGYTARGRSVGGTSAGAGPSSGVRFSVVV